MYLVHFLITPIIEEESIKKVINTIILCIILIFSTSNIKGILEYCTLDKYEEMDSPFYGAIVNPKLNNTVEVIDKYINNNDKKTIILSTYAPIISLSLNDLDNGEFDLALRGNLGKRWRRGVNRKN